MKSKVGGSLEDGIPRDTRLNAWSIVAGLVFVASLAIHLATFLPHPQISMDSVWFMQLAVFVPFGRMVIILAKHARDEARDTKKGYWKQIDERNERTIDATWQIVRGVRPYLLVLGIVFLIYVPFNFLMFFAHLGRGAPVEVRGNYYLSDHGTYTRQLSKEEYQQYQAYEVRGFSGHWMIFSFVPLIYFRFKGRQIESFKR